MSSELYKYIETRINKKENLLMNCTFCNLFKDNLFVTFFIRITDEICKVPYMRWNNTITIRVRLVCVACCYYVSSVPCKCRSIMPFVVVTLVSTRRHTTAYAWVCVSYYNCVLPQSSRRSLSAASGNRAAASGNTVCIKRAPSASPD